MATSCRFRVPEISQSRPCRRGRAADIGDRHEHLVRAKGDRRGRQQPSEARRDGRRTAAAAAGTPSGWGQSTSLAVKTYDPCARPDAEDDEQASGVDAPTVVGIVGKWILGKDRQAENPTSAHGQNATGVSIGHRAVPPTLPTSRAAKPIKRNPSARSHARARPPPATRGATRRLAIQRRSLPRKRSHGELTSTSSLQLKLARLDVRATTAAKTRLQARRRPRRRGARVLRLATQRACDRGLRQQIRRRAAQVRRHAHGRRRARL